MKRYVSETSIALFACVILILLSCLKPNTPSSSVKLPASDLWARRLKCQELGRAKVASDDSQEREARRRGEASLLRFPGEYCYNESLDTCICDEHWIGDLYEYRRVVDLLTGHNLAEFRTGVGGPTNRAETSQ